jgi:poly(hydroxyalkanoate) depolymerase family esterase
VPGLGDNILSLSKLRQRRDSALANLAEPLRLTLVAPAGANPGELRMLTYVPPGLPQGAPLVVALHGCTQNAAAYDYGSGWSTLAERHGFALLLPEQQRSNNPSLCFNWFQPQDITSGQGEVESIRQMVQQMITTHRLDPRRVFITGLSAGGAMTAAMLATSPELFAGGAIIAGLPFGSAATAMEAFSAMGQVRRHDPAAWGDLVRAASIHAGPFPPVQIWHGLADDTVSPANGEALLAQWANVLGVPGRPDMDETIDGAQHQVWLRDGRPVLENWVLPGLGHGTPIMNNGPDADHSVGVASPYMLDAGISSTWHLAQSWGLLTQAARPRAAKPTARSSPVNPIATAGAVIEKALKAAGLIK